MEDNLKDYLIKYHIEYQEYTHDFVFTVKESKKIKSEIPGMHCKCLFLTDGVGYYLLGMPADKRLDSKKLRKILNTKNLYFGDPEKMYDLIKVKPGSVSIFGMINDKNREVVLLLDKEVWNAEKLGFHPNINNSTLVLNHENLVKFYESIKNNKRVVDL